MQIWFLRVGFFRERGFLSSSYTLNIRDFRAGAHCCNRYSSGLRDSFLIVSFIKPSPISQIEKVCFDPARRAGWMRKNTKKSFQFLSFSYLLFVNHKIHRISMMLFVYVIWEICVHQKTSSGNEAFMNKQRLEFILSSSSSEAPFPGHISPV